MAVGMVINVILFFSISFIFAGANIDAWVKAYFGGQGIYFALCTLFLGFCVYPFIKHLNIVDRKS